VLLREAQDVYSPIDLDVRLLNSSDHTMALAMQKIASKATGDVDDAGHIRSKCIELMLAA